MNSDKKESCSFLVEEFYFFDGLILDIRMRKVLFDAFEAHLVDVKVDETFPGNNDFVQMIIRGYLAQQLLDLAKFFDRYNKSYSFKFLLKHTVCDFQSDHEKLFNKWKYGLGNIRNKVFAHSQKGFKKEKVKRDDVDYFINDIIQLFEKIIEDLVKKHQISPFCLKDEEGPYLSGVGDDVELFFNTLINKQE